MARRSFIFSSIWWWFWFVSWSVVYTLLSMPVLLIANPIFDPSRRWHHVLNRFWARVTMRVAFGAGFRVHGLEKLPPQDRPCVIVSNHQSLLDILITLTIPRQTRYVVKHDMFFVPLLGFHIWAGGYIGLRRGDPSSANRMRKRAAAYLEKSFWMMMFPEGTRSADLRVARFRKGAFQMARDAGAIILPICITGSGRMLPKGAFFSPEYNQVMDLRILDPVPAEEVAATEPGEMASRLREIIARAVSRDTEAQEAVDTQRRAAA